MTTATRVEHDDLLGDREADVLRRHFKVELPPAPKPGRKACAD